MGKGEFMKYKMVVSDVDGTLVDSRQTILPANLAVIRRFQELGGLFTLATGRTEYSANVFFADLGINAPAILYNGGGIFDVIKKMFVFESLLTQAAVAIVYEALEQYDDLNPIFYSKLGHPLVRSLNRVILGNMIKDSVQCRAFKAPEEVLEIPVRKVLVIGEPSDLVSLAEKVKRKMAEINIVRSEETYLEFLPMGVSKGAALTYLARHLGIHMKEIVAIGDNLNDLELLQTAGMGVAVANAHEELKKVASYISPHTNEEGAVAEAISRFCL